MSRGRFGGMAIMILLLGLASVGVIVTATRWPFKTALFPVGIGLAVLIMSSLALILTLAGKGKAKGLQVASDFSLTDEVDESTALKRTWAAFAWIIGFFFLIVMFSFNIGIILFVFLYVKLQGREKWPISIAMTAGAWFFFWALFIWLLETPMPDGLFFRALGIG